MTARFNAAQAAYGESYLLLTVLACVLGGVNPAGGFGKVSGLFIAIVVLQIVATGFNLLRLSSHLANALGIDLDIRYNHKPSHNGEMDLNGFHSFSLTNSAIFSARSTALRAS